MERRTFRVPPGRYRLRVRVRDLNSGEMSTVSEPLEVPDYSRVPLALADLELGVMGADGRFVPAPARQFGYDSGRLAGRVAIVDRRDGAWPRTYALRYRILDESGQELARGERSVTLARAGEPAIVRPDSAAWFVGTYTFGLELESGRAHWRTERTFEVEESGPPRGQEFRRMLEPLAFIAAPGEIDELGHAAESQQVAAWEAFWKRRDPTPDTPRNEALLEFLRRVRYADQHFQHFGPGWRSDMGRIYIKFGPPDQIETRPATLQSPPVEVWYYTHPLRQFVFADREGFGRYVLVGPGAE
jgi:GWxTD domain-containing protein